MGKSLQDQLLGMGLTNQKKAKQAEKAKSKKVKEARKTNTDVVDEAKLLAEQTRKEKIAKDKELNRQKNAEAHKKAVVAQIKQLIKVNAIPKKGDVEYKFSDGTKIKKIFIDDQMVGQLSRGILVLSKVEQSYELIPAAVADKIKIRDDSYIIVQNDAQEMTEEEKDWYGDFEIPDDLMW
jgi:uncharacterized protein YaiL (DUF2058 family)